jgi:diguanylate cyclase (GGDEF)-like protein
MAVSTAIAISTSMSAIYVTDLVLPNFDARFDNYAFAFGIPLGVSPLLVYPLVHVNYRMEMVQEQLRRMARTDPLTGLANRRAFFEQAERAFDEANGMHAMPVALMMVDIDHFKQINDSLGHAAGDAVLNHAGQTISNAVKRSNRETDCLVARIGGEEFAVLLTGDGARTATAVAEGICRLARRSALPVGDVNVTVTVSVGVAARTGMEMVDAVMNAADRAVYEAKRAGRDRWLLAANEDLDSCRQQIYRQGGSLAEPQAA